MDTSNSMNSHLNALLRQSRRHSRSNPGISPSHHCHLPVQSVVNHGIHRYSTTIASASILLPRICAAPRVKSLFLRSVRSGRLLRFQMPDYPLAILQLATMKPSRAILKTVAASCALVLLAFSTCCVQAQATKDFLPSWNEGPAKQAIENFIQATTDPSSPTFVSPEERIATFDQDGTLWVEHPMFSQVMYCLDQVQALVEKKPELKKVEPFKTVLSGDREAISKLPMKDLEKILAATLTGMSVDEFNTEVKKWIATAKDPRWKKPYTELTYQPMLELLQYLRANGYKTYIVTGGGQDFVRVYSEPTYGIPVEQVVGTAGGTKYGYTENGKPFLTKDPKLLLNDNNAGKPEGIHFMIGRRPHAAFGNSTGDRQMLEYTKAGNGARLAMLVLHDDARREYAYGPAQGLPDTKVGTFTQELYDEAKKDGWTVISMKKDWNRIFSWEK